MTSPVNETEARLALTTIERRRQQEVAENNYRRASSRLSVRGDLVSRRIPMLVIGFLIVMTLVTIGLALLFDADGARHPATLASVVVGAVLVSGGPSLMGLLRRRAEHHVA